MVSSPIVTNVKFHIKFTSAWHAGKQNLCTNVCHTRATVTALLEFLYKWMRLHLVYIIAMLVCENRKGSPTK